MDNPFSLVGKKVVVTGGKGFLGRELVMLLKEQEAEVVATDILADDDDPHYYSCDITCSESVGKFMSWAAEKMGRIDCLINCAAKARLVPVEFMTDEDWDETVKVSLYGSFNSARAAYPYLKASRGCVVNVASIAGLIGLPRGTTHHSAAKAGIIGMTRSLAVEWAKQGIRVNAIAPGQFDTGPLRLVMENPEQAKAILMNIPLGRIGTSREIALAIQFLASDAASFMTGQTLVVDGGTTIF